MGKRNTEQILEDFKKDFGLINEQMNKIVKPGFSEEKRAKVARRLDVFRKEAMKYSKKPTILSVLLYVSDDCKVDHFDLLVQGEFDKAIESMVKFREWAEKERKIEKFDPRRQR